MTAVSDVEMVEKIMSEFRNKRARWLRDHRTRDERNLPASLSRAVEALTVVKAVQSGRDLTQAMIGHHP